MDITFIDGSWSFVATAPGAAPTVNVTLTNSQWLTVNFDAVVPAGFTWMPTSILDLTAEFSLATAARTPQSGTGTVRW